MSFSCALLGHRWYFVYSQAESQHPQAITRDHESKMVTMCGDTFPDIEVLYRCRRCAKEEWR